MGRVRNVLLYAYMVLGYSPYCQLVLWWNLNFIMVSEQGCPRVKPNGHTRSRSPSCCPRVGLKIRHTCGGHVESCPTLVRDKVCYMLIWSWATPHIANWFYGGTSISSRKREYKLFRRREETGFAPGLHTKFSSQEDRSEYFSES